MQKTSPFRSTTALGVLDHIRRDSFQKQSELLTAQAASWTWPENRPVVILDLDPQGDASG